MKKKALRRQIAHSGCCLFFVLVVCLPVRDVFGMTLWEEWVSPWVGLHFYLTEKKQAPTPTQAIKDLDGMLTGYHTGDDLTRMQQMENRRLKRRILYGTFDLRELCRIALGKHWKGRTAQEQDDFVALMTALLEEKAILSKEQGQKKAGSSEVYKVSYKGHTMLAGNEQHKALVKTGVYVPSHKVTIDLNYKVRLGSSIWKIYDVIVDDSSLVENYRFQFDGIITEHGYADLIRRMEEKLTEIQREHS